MRFVEIFIIATLLITSLTAYGQRRYREVKPIDIEDLPRKPVDTIKTSDPETQVIIYSNNTWEFYRPDIHNRLANHDAYKYNWDTTSIFSYRNVELEDLSEVIELKLFDSIPQFCVPVKGKVLSKFGVRKRRPHHGVDIPLKIGEPILATFDGKIRYAKFNSGGYGYLVIVRHPNGLETWYAHLSRVNVNENDYVKAGQIIGFGGNTGRSRGPHLHYEMRFQDQAFDPEFVIDFETGQARYQNFALERRYLSVYSRASQILEEDDSIYDSQVPEVLLAHGDDSTSVKLESTNPVKPKPQVQGVYHTIKSGDTLGHIAAKYGVSVNQICNLNGITRTTILQLNRKLLIK